MTDPNDTTPGSVAGDPNERGPLGDGLPPPSEAASASMAAPSPRIAIPRANARRSRWFGLVWAVPLAALLIVAFLGIRGVADRGVDVVVTFDTGAGARVDDTKVIYQGVEAGRVVKIDINEDGHRVDMTLRMNPHADLGLTTTTKFWLVGANVSLNDISSVKAALAGLTIGVAPGIGGEPARHFIGLNEPPIIMPGTPGTAYVLNTANLGTVSPGSPIFYRGMQIGRVTGVRLSGPAAFRLDVFVLAPFDKMIRSASAFWISSPVQVSLTDKGASATLEHAGSVLNGAIEFDALSADVPPAQSRAGTEFPLYPSRKDAETGPIGPEVPYAMRFVGPAGELIEGAPVRLLGFQIGAVKSVRLELDPKTGEAATSVLAVLYPSKLHVETPPGTPDANAWQRATDAAVSKLLATGHRARLVQTPPLIGGRVVSFDAVSGAGAGAGAGSGAGVRVATLGAAQPGQPRLIPSDDASGGIDEITGQVNQLLAKLNRFPLEGIGNDVKRITSKLEAIVSSPQLTDSLSHLDSTLAQADEMMRDVKPQVGPLVAKLNRAADEVTGTAAAAHDLIGGAAGGGAGDGSLPAAIRELSDAARSIRALADYLGRHPESLIRGRGTDAADSAPNKDKR